MLSFLPQPYFHIGSWNIMMYDLMFIMSIFTGRYVFKQQALRYGLEQRVVMELFLIALFVGVPFAHILAALWSMPKLVWANPEILLHFNKGLDSFGFFLGSALGLLVYVKIRRKFAQPILAYLDSVAYAMCGAWIVCRLGCAFSHDHPGRPSADFFAIQYPDWVHGGLSRHNLGLDEALGTFLIFMILYRLDREPRQHGVIAATFMILYGLMRFCLDFLRATDLSYSDVRYASLTTSQWGCFVLLLMGIFIMIKVRRNH